MQRTLSIVLVAAACGADGVGPIEGDTFIDYPLTGCMGLCAATEVFRSGDQLDLVLTYGETREVVGHNEGTLTREGRQALDDLTLQFGPEASGGLGICSPTDGNDLHVTLDRDGMQYTLSYCIEPTEFPQVAALTDFAFSVVTSLTCCTQSSLIDLGYCEAYVDQ